MIYPLVGSWTYHPELAWSIRFRMVSNPVRSFGSKTVLSDDFERYFLNRFEDVISNRVCENIPVSVGMYLFEGFGTYGSNWFPTRLSRTVAKHLHANGWEICMATCVELSKNHVKAYSATYFVAAIFRPLRTTSDHLKAFQSTTSISHIKTIADPKCRHPPTSSSHFNRMGA